MIKPPAGYELDQPEVPAPPPGITAPAGYELDPTPSKGYWSDVARNAKKEVTDIARSIPVMAEGASNILKTPIDAVRYAAGSLVGAPYEGSALSKDLQTGMNAAQIAPIVVKETAKDLLNTVVHPVNSFREKPVGTASNAFLLAGGVGSLMEKAAPEVATALETSANAMGRRATGFTKALIKGKNFDKANDAVQWMMDKKIMTPGADTETMLERASSVKDEAWQRMAKTFEDQNAGATGALSPKAKPQLREQFLFDPNKAVGDLEGLRPRAGNGKVLKGGQYDTQNAEIDDAIATIQAHGERPIPWNEANNLKKNFNANWDTTKSSAVNNLRKRIYGTFDDSLESQMDAAAQARGGNIKDFLAAKQDYGTAKRAEKALDNLRSSRAGNRIIGLTDTIVGAGGAAANGAPGMAASILAKKLIERYGLTTGATMAKKLSVIASKAPELIGPYAPALRKALVAGGSELAFTHGILAQNDPNYRALVSALAEKN